jgi:hypothetical protein
VIAVGMEARMKMSHAESGLGVRRFGGSEVRGFWGSVVLGSLPADPELRNP